MDTTQRRNPRQSSSRGGRRPFTGNTRRSGAPTGDRRRPFHARAGGNDRPRGRGGKKMKSFDPSQFINTNPIEIEEIPYVATHTFEQFGLSAPLAKNIAAKGLVHPTPIQDQIIPDILKGRDVIGLAQTGTGKTAAFLIPLIENISKNSKRQVLILTPTRELALQIDAELKGLSKGMRIFSTVVVGGTSMYPQVKALRSFQHFVIGTPGRVLDLIRQQKFDTSKVSTVVLDEADRMLDMGFINDMRSILSTIPESRETLLFSATMSKDMDSIVRTFLRDPSIVSVKKKDVIDSIEQDVVRFQGENKYELLLALLSNPTAKRVIVFSAMKHSAERLAKDLSHSGVKADSIHGNKSHGQRQRSLGNFKRGEVRVLVATDVAARGIHVDDVSHVINYDLPNSFEDYVHRIGRTGRGSKRGKALTFVPGSAR